MIILIIALTASIVSNSLTLNRLDRENMLFNRQLATLKADNERGFDSAKNEFKKSDEETQKRLTYLESGMQNKITKEELETIVTAQQNALATKADKQAMANLENAIFQPAKIYVETRKAVVDVNGGSGFLFKGKTQIVTAYHVVKADPGTIVLVVTHDDLHLFITGKVKKIKPEWDLALIELDLPLDAEPLSPSKNPLFIGEPVMIVGSPAGFNNSASAGIISGLNRDISQFPKISFIQSDASSYFGNSGGPVINGNNEVIGVVSQGAENFPFSFAVPINYVQLLIEEK